MKNSNLIYPRAVGFDNGRNTFWFCSPECLTAHGVQECDSESEPFPKGEKCIECSKGLARNAVTAELTYSAIGQDCEYIGGSDNRRSETITGDGLNVHQAEHYGHGTAVCLSATLGRRFVLSNVHMSTGDIAMLPAPAYYGEGITILKEAY